MGFGMIRVSPIEKGVPETSLRVTRNGVGEKLGKLLMIDRKSRMVPFGPIRVIPGRWPPPYLA